MTGGGRGQPKPARPAGTTDQGLAQERTTLAWTRSSIAFAAMGVAILKQRPVIGAPLLVLSAVIWTAGRARRRPGLAGLAPRRVVFITICVTVVGLIALAIALAGPSPRGFHF